MNKKYVYVDGNTLFFYGYTIKLAELSKVHEKRRTAALEALEGTQRISQGYMQALNDFCMQDDLFWKDVKDSEIGEMARLYIIQNSIQNPEHVTFWNPLDNYKILTEAKSDEKI